MTDIRGVGAADLDALYAICLATGDAGQDAGSLYRDPRLVGELYAAPYAVLAPDSAFVAQDEVGVGGYIVGTANTPAFEERLEAEWWPALRRRYAEPLGDPAGWNLDELRAWQIHHPRPPPARVTGPFPAHLHINLTPRLQGQGLGKALIDRWLGRMRELGASGVHLGVAAQNHRAIRFYRAYGFDEFVFPRPRPEPDSLYFTMTL
ncbi:MAG TPA: GNAT family N-acetyltransferase [Caulobacteraceae bacterium]